jgi:hypothetical protein
VVLFCLFLPFSPLESHVRVLMLSSSLHHLLTCSTLTTAVAPTVTPDHHINLQRLSQHISYAAGHMEFTYAPEDEDIFFNVSDGSDSGSVDPGCGPYDTGAIDAQDVAMLGARCGCCIPL